MEVEIKSKSIELVPVGSLIQHPKNMHKHSEEQIYRLCELIKYQGFRNPLIVQAGTNLVVAGHGRLLAAQRLGLELVPVIYQEFKSEEQLYAYLVSDNAIGKDSWAQLDLSMINVELENLGPEFNIDMLGIKDFVLEPVEKFDPQCDEDDVPDVKEDPVTKRGDIWILGNHRLMCGDSTMIDDVEKLMNGESADFGFCDPPYNLGFEYNSYDDNKTNEEYGEFSKLWFSNLQQFTSRQAVTLGTKNIKTMSDLSDSVAGVGCWVKKNWITSCHIAKLQQWEPIFFYGDFTKHKRSTDLYEINRKIQKDVGDKHTCPKQIELLDEILTNYCNESVLDLFGGSGTTLISAEKNRKKSYLLELDPVYVDVIINRWQNYTGKDAVLESSDETYNSLRSKHAQRQSVSKQEES